MAEGENTVSLYNLGSELAGVCLPDSDRKDSYDLNVNWSSFQYCRYLFVKWILTEAKCMRYRIIFTLIVLQICSANTIIHAQTVKDTACTVYFRTNEYRLDSAAVKQLTLFVQHSPEIVGITGYADSTGTSAYNVNLSRLRAQTVYSFLLKNRVKVAIRPDYAGEIVLENTGLQQCRKVEVMGRFVTGASTADNVSARRDTVRISLDNIFFLPDRTILAPESIPYVEEVAKSLLRYKGYNIKIVGHVNYQGYLRKDTVGLNALAEKRAKVLSDMFADMGLPKGDMTYMGVGNTQPAISDPKTYEDKTRNMRVQIFLIPKN